MRDSITEMNVQGGLFSSSAEWGKDENPRGGAKKRVNWLIQNFDKSV